MLKTILTLIGLTMSISANAAFESRLGGLAYYDTQTDLTWLTDANAAGTRMSWAEANAWTSSLSVAGVGGWRLPSAGLIDPVNPCHSSDGTCDWGENITRESAELAHLFFSLGNQYDTLPSGDPNPGPYFPLMTGPFTNVNSGNYWLQEDYLPWVYDAWTFSLHAWGASQKPDGGSFNWTVGGPFNWIVEGWCDKCGPYYVWAVQSGDVGEVPIPAAAWLFGSALLGLGMVKRRKT